MSEKKDFKEYDSVTLTFDNDLVVECAIIDLFDYEDNKYIALVPVVEVEGIEEDEMFLYRYLPSDDPEELNLEEIEDDDVYDAVYDKLVQRDKDGISILNEIEE